MKTRILLAGLLLLSTGSFAQIERCLSHKAIEYQESLTPGYANLVNTVFENAKAYSANNLEKSNHLYTIPVVVHVVYNTPEQNIPDSVVLDQIRVLNEDYNRQNADTVNMRTDFDIVKGNPQIEFMLAQIDPLGAPTTGITRTATSQYSFGSTSIIFGNFSDLEKVKSTLDGGIDPWDQSRYLNIWVCNMSVDVFGTEVTALLGYATPPTGLPNWPPGSTAGLSDGVVIQYQAFGSNNPNVLDPGTGPITVLGRTPVHEVGHYLGLRHIWGDGDCTAQDGINDTPNADSESDQSCVLDNSCTDTIVGVDLPDMIENYMDYSAETCQNTFTQGQVDLMHGVLDNERYDLVHNNPAGIASISTVDWNVYPNPAESQLTISGIESTTTMELISIAGQLVDRMEISANHTLNVSQLESGVYIMKLSSNETTKSFRVVIR